MTNLITFFIKHKIWSNAVLFTICATGLYFLLGVLDTSFFPEQDPKNVTVQVAYPGASPEEMEEAITIRIEEALKGVVGIKETNSTSSENFAMISVTADDNVDLEELSIEVKNAVDKITGFPAGAEKPVVFKQKALTDVLYLALVGDVKLETLKETAEQIENDFLKSGLISQYDLTGYPELEISIEVSESQLQRYGVTFDEIVQAVRAGNRDISAGSIRGKDEELLIRSNNRSTKAEDIAEIPVLHTESGAVVTVGEIASNVKVQFAETPNMMYYNGEPAVQFLIRKLPEEDLVEISDFIAEYIDEFNATNDVMYLEIMWNFRKLLDERIEMLESNGLIGLVLVLLSLGLFMNVRLSFWVALGIPVSFLGMFAVGALFGMSINMISLFGMILVVGILVDDGIVIGENIFAEFENGRTVFNAALIGTKDVFTAVFTSITTTIIAFLPILFLEQFSFVQEVALVVVIALFFSLIEASIVLPAHLSSTKVLRKSNKNSVFSRWRAATDRLLATLRDGLYGSLLDHTLKYRYVYVILPVAFVGFIVTMLVTSTIETRFFPVIAFDNFTVEMSLKPGEREDKTFRILKELEREVWAVNQEIYDEIGDSVIHHTTLSVGSSDKLGEIGGHAGNIFVSLDTEDNGFSPFEVLKRVQERIPSVPEAEKYSVQTFNRWGKPVSIQLLSKDREALSSAALFLKEELRQYPTLKNVTDNAAIGKREVLLELKERAYALGLTQNDIARQVRQGFFGEEAQRLIVGTEEAKVWVRYQDADRLSLSALEDLRIKTPSGASYLLGELVDYSIERGVVNIKHYQGSRVVGIEADLVNAYDDVPGILSNISETVLPELQSRYPSVDIEYGGQQKRGQETGQAVGQWYTIALLVMFLVIALNFKSWYQGGLIILLIPIGLACAVLGHWIETVFRVEFLGAPGVPVTILSFYGMLALAGVVVNDAVVLLAKYNQNIKSGMTVMEAARNAGIARFRAILLTTVTTVAGLMPLIRETDFQAQFLIPMAISVAYGILFATFFILVCFPPMIVVGSRIRAALFRVIRNDTSNNEAFEPTVLEEAKIQHLLHDHMTDNPDDWYANKDKKTSND